MISADVEEKFFDVFFLAFVEWVVESVVLVAQVGVPMGVDVLVGCNVVQHTGDLLIPHIHLPKGIEQVIHQEDNHHRLLRIIKISESVNRPP